MRLVVWTPGAQVIQKLLDKTGASNRTALVRRALQLGYLTLEPIAPRELSVIVTRPPEARGGRLPPGRPRAQLGEGQSRAQLPPGRPPTASS